MNSKITPAMKRMLILFEGGQWKSLGEVGITANRRTSDLIQKLVEQKLLERRQVNCMFEYRLTYEGTLVCRTV